MRPTYDGVRYYGKNDMSIGMNLKKAEPVINAFDASKEYGNINEVLELYSIQKLIDIGATLSSWAAEQYSEYQKTVKQFSKSIGKFYSGISDENFIDIESKVSVGYIDMFWEVFVQFKAFDRVSEDIFEIFLKQPDANVHLLLRHKKLVDHYNFAFAKVLRSSKQTPRILARKFLEKTKEECYLPNALLPSEFESIFQKYIESDDSNVKVLELIYKAQSTAECPISDKLRLSAKRATDEFWKKQRTEIIFSKYGVGVKFQEQDELKRVEQNGSDLQFSYDIKWLEESLDYPSILNNFCYTFEMFDNCWRSALVSVKSQISALEKVLITNGIRFYPRGSQFAVKDMISQCQMSAYLAFLSNHGINLEEVFKWFFEEYLKEEFGVSGFSLVISAPQTTYVEKCRNLASEIDGVLKMFRMFVRDGQIDRELYEMSSEHMVLEGIPTLLDEKYAYSASTDILDVMHAFFSDQSTLTYNRIVGDKYDSFFEMISQENFNINDFEAYQQGAISWLNDKGYLEDNDGIIKPTIPKVWILKDLYEHDVICLHSLNGWKAVIDEMISSGQLVVENTLFSKPETDYLNFELNKSTFSDGLDLRNKYDHSTYPIDEKKQKDDYIRLLKLMVLVITKMNHEFCIWAENKVTTDEALKSKTIKNQGGVEK